MNENVITCRVQEEHPVYPLAAPVARLDLWLLDCQRYPVDVLLAPDKRLSGRQLVQCDTSGPTGNV